MIEPEHISAEDIVEALDIILDLLEEDMVLAAVDSIIDLRERFEP